MKYRMVKSLLSDETKWYSVCDENDLVIGFVMGDNRTIFARKKHEIKDLYCAFIGCMGLRILEPVSDKIINYGASCKQWYPISKYYDNINDVFLEFSELLI